MIVFGCDQTVFLIRAVKVSVLQKKDCSIISELKQRQR